MRKLTIYKPPHNIAERRRDLPSIFLAGSIEMGKAEDWQTEICDKLDILAHADAKNGYNIFNPRRDDWDSSWKQGIKEPQFYQQVNWEMNALDQADLIIMYFSPETKSPISLLELGLHATSGKMLVCCPEGFWRKGNVDMVCDKYNIPSFTSLQKLVNYIRYIK